MKKDNLYHKNENGKSTRCFITFPIKAILKRVTLIYGIRFQIWSEDYCRNYCARADVGFLFFV